MQNIDLNRECENWLQTLAEFVEDTESPRQFWFWSGVSTICSTLQRKVWIPYREKIYPNLYVLLVARPGWCRKGPPVAFSKKILTDIDIPVFVDSPTKRSFTQTMAELGKSQHYVDSSGRPHTHSSISVISKEMSSLLAVNPKEMIECLTDLWDSHDTWDYKTSGKGEDKLYGVCVNGLWASTPSWLGENLPESAIGGGYTSRIVVVYGDCQYKRVAIPPEPNEDLYKKLVHDLMIIKTLTGEFTWGDGAENFFKNWYDNAIPALMRATHDERLHAYLARIHVMVLKTAMALRVATSNELLITRTELTQATHLCESILAQAAKAFGGQGRSRQALDVNRVMEQVRTLKEVSFMQLLQINFRHTNREELVQILDTIEAMGKITRHFIVDRGKNREFITWVNQAELSKECEI